MKRFNPLKPQTPSSAPLTKARKAPREPGAAEFTTTLTENERKDGLEIRFATRPADDILTTLKAHGWYWSRRRMCWYHKNTPENREFAQRFLNPVGTTSTSSDFHPTSTAAASQPIPNHPLPITNSNVIPVQFAPAATEPTAVPLTPASVPWRARLLSH